MVLWKTPTGQDLESIDYSTVFDSIDDIKYGSWQLERCPQSGRLHLQCYLELRGAYTVGRCKEFLGQSAHLERRIGTRDEAIDYTRKPDTRVLGPWEKGVRGSVLQGKRNDLADLSAAILGEGMSVPEVIRTFPSEFLRYSRGVERMCFIRDSGLRREFRRVQVVVYWGVPGTGKTRKAIDDAQNDFFILEVTGSTLWFDGYNGERTLILDDFGGGITLPRLLRILDGHPLRLDVKGSFTYAAWTTVVITSNVHPGAWYSRDAYGGPDRRPVSGPVDETPDGGIPPALRRRITEIRHVDAPLYDDIILPDFLQQE